MAIHLLAITVFFGVANGAVNAPSCTAPCAISLDGEWRFMSGHLTPSNQYAVPVDDTTWEKIAVPANWHSEGYELSGSAWYRRHFAVPAELAGKQIRLAFHGIDYAADVWLNGEYVGFHEGYFQHFDFDVSHLIRSGKDNVVAVRVDSPYEEIGTVWSLRKRLIKGIFSHHDTRPGGAWSVRGQEQNTGGIWNRVELLVSQQLVLDTLRITPSVDASGSSGSVVFTLGVRNSNKRAARFDFNLAITPVNFAGTALRSDTSMVVAPGASRVEFQMAIPDAKLWWPSGHGQPNLYRLAVEARRGKRILDRTEQIFGLRTVQHDATNGAWIVNGRRLFLRGTNYIPTQWLSEMTPASYLRDVQLMKDANINAVRVHAHVGAEEFYRVCDEQGMLVWQDFPLQWGYQDSTALHDAALQQSAEMVEQLFNHPSIFVWSLHNEPPWNASWMTYKYPDYDPEQNRTLDDLIFRRVQSLDSTRYVQRLSATAEHQWLGWYSGSWTDFAKPTKEKLITEFGAQALPQRESLRKIFTDDELWPDTAAEWDKWSYHNFQRHETFDIAHMPMGKSTDEFIANSQQYQARLIQLAAESYRRQKYRPVGAIFQFMFVEDWPSISWGVVDNWRQPKPGYAALKLAYQPLLPSIEWSGEPLLPRKPIRFGLWIVNDTDDRIVGARYRYSLRNARDADTHSEERTIDIEPDSSRKVMDSSTFTLEAGAYALTAVVLAADGAELARNRFDFVVAAPPLARKP
jgi:beta-mannosidase